MKTDEKIKTDVVGRLASDSRIDASDIKVEVDAGKVILSGDVLSYTDRIKAEDTAWYVSGVIDVENKLKVVFPSTFTVPSDDDIKKSINQLLEWNVDVNADEVDVEVDNGFVTLEGSVPTYWQKIQAEDDASRAKGVITVTNKIAVVPTEKISDEMIGESVMDRIEQNAPVHLDEIDAKVKNGEVTLTGMVPTYNVWSSIYYAAQNTLGVTGVHDEVSIKYD